MKRGAKVSVFIISMGLTLGSLIGFAGPRHHWHHHHGMHGHGWCGHSGYYQQGNCGDWNNCAPDSLKAK
jgi:hypothetical protein